MSQKIYKNRLFFLGTTLIIIFFVHTTLITSLHAPVGFTPAQTDQSLEENLYEWSRIFAQVMQLAKDKHFKIKDITSCMMKAINSFLNDLDPHSSFLEPKTYKMMLETTSGEFFGIGIVIDNTRNAQDKFLTVIDTIPDGPADKAGVEPMDKIVEIGGKSLEGMTTEEATSLLKGARNTSVNIKVMRTEQQDLFPFDIKRDIVKEQTSLSFYIPEHNLYYLSLTMFSENAMKNIQNLLEKASKNSYKGLILDLRNNSGGLLNAAVDISGLFIDKNSLVATTKDKHNKDIELYHTSKNPIANQDLPIFILINNYTASAAEILAGTLKIHSQKYAQQSPDQKQKMAVFLVGTKSFGKGSVQEVIPVNNNCAVKLTTSLYYLPNDTTIQGTGIEPDFVIEKTFPPTKQMMWFASNYGREQAFENHIQATKESENKKTIEAAAKAKSDAEEKEKNSEKRWIDRAKKMLQNDNQLRETISLINLLNTAHTLCPQEVCNREKAVVFLKNNHLSHDNLQLEEIKE
ncbi:MAG: S41 family peptidase [Candidatus Dependentiae bacterium]|nr:S41 family peptidase [Candidatus Dependentiae bacterium]